MTIKNRSKVKILEKIKTTIGGMHSWYKAEVDGVVMNIRKPNGKVK